MKKVHLGGLSATLLTCLFLAGSSTSLAGILKFKMTNGSLPVLPGFARVTAETEYTPEGGYGWTRGNRVEWQKLEFGIIGPVLFTGTYPDIISGSWVAPGRCSRTSYVSEQFDFQDEAEFRVDAPPGKYVVHMILGDYYYMAGYVNRLRRPYSVSINGVEAVSVRLTEEEIAALYYKHEYTDYDPALTYWRRYVKPRFDGTTYTVSAESDGSLRIAVRGIPVAMIAVWPEAESDAAKAWLRELEKTREASCELREFDHPLVKPLAPTPEQRRRGYALFAADYMSDITAYTVPAPGALESDVKAFAAQGECEPATFGIYPFKRVEQFRVKVGKLRNEAGDALPASCINVRFVKYMESLKEGAPVLRYVLKPLILVAWKEVTVYEGVTRQCWLTIHVPESTPPGTYTGEIEVSASNAPTSTKKLILKVLPFRLRTLTEDDRYVDLTISYIYPRHPSIWPGTDEKEMSRKLMKAWADYGFNLAQANSGVLPYNRIRLVDGKVIVDLSHTEEWLKGWTDAGVTLKGVNFNNLAAWSTCALIKKKAPGYRETSNEVKTFPPEFDAVCVSLVQAVDEGFRQRGWPTPVFYEGGEGGGYEEGRYYELYVHGLLHKAGVRNSLSLSGDMEYFKQIVPLLWAPYDYYFNREKYEWMKAHNINMFYKATFNRFERGLFFWRINAKGHHAETFCYGGFGDPYNLFSEVEGSGLAFPSRDNDGVNPTLTLEREVREGHDDARYLFHLEWLIREATRTGNTANLAAAEQARATLDRIRDPINPDLEYYRATSGYPSNDVYQKIRWRVAREIIKLQDVIKENAERP